MGSDFVALAVTTHLSELQAREKTHRALYAVFQKLGDPGLLWSDWIALAATLLSYRPATIIELGRGHGASTCLFRFLGFPTISICRTNNWQVATIPLLHDVEPIDWHDGVTAIIGEIAHQDYAGLIGASPRVVIFWDAHGYDVADVVLGDILPILAGREVMVVCHDIRDSRYFRDACGYGGAKIWRSQNDPAMPWIRLGNIHSSFEQLVSLVDFASRNQIAFRSPTHELMQSDITRTAYSDSIWPYCLWHYFELPLTGELTFPARA